VAIGHPQNLGVDPIHLLWQLRHNTENSLLFSLLEGNPPRDWFAVDCLVSQVTFCYYRALPIWRPDEENGAVALRITRRGLAAIRIDEHRAFLETQEASAIVGTGMSSLLPASNVALTVCKPSSLRS
jgi:hypothetical protein